MLGCLVMFVENVWSHISLQNVRLEMEFLFLHILRPTAAESGCPRMDSQPEDLRGSHSLLKLRLVDQGLSCASLSQAALVQCGFSQFPLVQAPAPLFSS